MLRARRNVVVAPHVHRGESVRERALGVVEVRRERRERPEARGAAYLRGRREGRQG